MDNSALRAEIAAQLKDEAQQLLEQSGLLALLQQRFGETMITGSAGYDLMVWRDIDIHLPCSEERVTEWAALASEVAAELGRTGFALHRAEYINDYLDPTPGGAGLYWGFSLRDRAGNPWRCDIWGWEPFDYAVRQARDDNFRADLVGCDRDLILRLKHEALARDGYYGTLVTSFDIYEFAMAGAGQTLEELEAWKGIA
jgi:hypothetical protein